MRPSSTLIPTGIIGGISFVLYGMISAIGVRNVVENHVDFTSSRNLIVAAVILVCALGFNSVGGVSFAIAGVNINLSGLAIAAIAGIRSTPSCPATTTSLALPMAPRLLQQQPAGLISHTIK